MNVHIKRERGTTSLWILHSLLCLSTFFSRSFSCIERVCLNVWLNWIQRVSGFVYLLCTRIRATVPVQLAISFGCTLRVFFSCVPCMDFMDFIWEPILKSITKKKNTNSERNQKHKLSPANVLHCECSCSVVVDYSVFFCSLLVRSLVLYDANSVLLIEMNLNG